jgi:S-adenosylmethionine hydrolase
MLIEAWEVVEPTVMNYPPTPTWYGRDVVVACAGHLAAGVLPGRVGPPREVNSLTRLSTSDPILENGEVRGEVLRIDRFGNVWTNISLELVEILATGVRVDLLMVGINGHRFEWPLRQTFSQVPAGEPLVYVNSRSQISFAMNREFLADRYGISRGQPVTVQLAYPAEIVKIYDHRPTQT